jgi:hypothetical protein
MTGSNRNFNDNDLRDRFAALRREEEAQAPDFVVLASGSAARRRRRPAGKMIVLATCLAMMIAAAIFLLRPVLLKPKQGPGSPVASITEWKAPTDFLLETPGRELLRTVPAIGDWHGYDQTSGSPKHPQVRKHALP